MICFTNFSCDPIVSSPDYSYYIYIDGEKGKQVEVSYIQREDKQAPRKNITITETVTLPFFKETHFVYDGAFLEVGSSDDTTTKAIMFDDGTTLEDKRCPAIAVFYTENAVDNCAYCKELKTDSLFRYFKRIGYKGYIEFKKGDTTKRVQL